MNNKLKSLLVAGITIGGNAIAPGLGSAAGAVAGSLIPADKRKVDEKEDSIMQDIGINKEAQVNNNLDMGLQNRIAFGDSVGNNLLLAMNPSYYVQELIKKRMINNGV